MRQAAILFDKFHVLVIWASRSTKSARLTGKDRRYIKSQKYTLLSHRENLDLDVRKALEGRHHE